MELKNKFKRKLFILLNSFKTRPTINILNMAVSNSSLKKEIYFCKDKVIMNSHTTIKSIIFHPFLK